MSSLNVTGIVLFIMRYELVTYLIGVWKVGFDVSQTTTRILLILEVNIETSFNCFNLKSLPYPLLPRNVLFQS